MELREVGGYLLEEKLGEGGMGAVFRARHPEAPDRPVAVKVLLQAGRLTPRRASGSGASSPRSSRPARGTRGS